MIVVDDVVLAALQAIDGVDIHDGLVTVNTEGDNVDLDLPYAVYRSNIGDDDNRRLGGLRARRSVFFDLTICGEDRWQVKWAGEQIRAALQGKRLVIPGHRSWRCELQQSTRIFRDDDAVRSDGTPLFYGVDSYAVAIALT